MPSAQQTTRNIAKGQKGLTKRDDVRDRREKREKGRDRDRGRDRDHDRE